MQIETFAGLIQHAGIALPEVPRVSRARASAYSARPAFDAAGTGARQLKAAQDAAISALLMASGDELRRQVRQLVRNNAWASNALDSFTANAVGTGIVPSSLHPDPKIKAAIEQAWLRWTDESDADGLLDFYGQQALACRMQQEGGECFARLRPRRPQDGLSVPLQVQLLEAEQLPLAKNEDIPGGKIRAGIEFNPIGKRVAYHFYTEHPFAGASAQMFTPTETKRIPSVIESPGSGALHLFQPIRAAQLRGQPRFTPVLVKLYELDQFDDATLVKQKTLSFFALFIKRMTTNNSMGVMNEESDTEGEATVEMEPNTLQYLDPDEEVQEVGGKTPGADYATFMKVQLHAIAAGLGLTYEMLTGDLEGVTYSSIRQGVLEFRRKCEQFQHNVMVYQFCRPIWRAWMDAAVLSGTLRLPGYEQDPTPYLAVEWTPPSWPWVDPKTEVDAAVQEVRAGFTDRGAICKQKGTDRQTVDRKQAEDNASADAAKVKYDSDGRNAKAGAAPNQPIDGGQAK
jgi:lambda family phage portal protein